MYRLLSAKGLYQTNFKILTSINNGREFGSKCIACSSLKQSSDLSHFNVITSGYPNKSQNGLCVPFYTPIRILSTTPNADILMVSKLKARKRLKTKMYSDLIQIKNGTIKAKETKTSVHHLTSHQLTDFIEKPDILLLSAADLNRTETTTDINRPFHQMAKLNKTEKSTKKVNNIPPPLLIIGENSIQLTDDVNQLQQIFESYKIFKEVNVNSDESILLDSCEPVFDYRDPTKSMLEIDTNDQLIEEFDLYTDDFEQMEINEIRSPETVQVAQKQKLSKKDPKAKEKFNSKQHRTIIDEQLVKQKTLGENLKAYLEVCVYNNMLNRGLATLLNYRFRYKRYKHTSHMLNLNLFNILLSGYAAKGNIAKVQEILSILKTDNITLSAQSYAAIFECLGRMSPAQPNTLKLTQKYIDEAMQNSLTMNDVMNDSKFVFDQREIVLDAINRVEPNFFPIYTSPDITYKNVLLNDLNRNVQLAHIELRNESANVSGSEIMKSKSGFNKNDLIDLSKEQIEIEMDSVITIKSIEKFPDIDENVIHLRQQLEKLKCEWHSQIHMAFRRDLNTLKSQIHSKGSRQVNLFPYLRALDVQKYADILLHEIRSLAEGSESFSLPLRQLYRNLGNKVQIQYHIENKKKNGILDKTQDIYESYCDIMCGTYSSDNPRQSWQRLVYQNQSFGPSMNIEDRSWPTAITIGIGRFLYQILMHDIKIDGNIVRTSTTPKSSKSTNVMPAFYTLFRSEGKNIKEEIKPHPVLIRLFRGSQQETLTFDSNSVPMVCPPQPWSTPFNGGYLLARSDLIRLPQQAYQQWEIIRGMSPTNMYPSLDSLNQLASIPWRVNKQILDVILSVFNDGGSKELNIPQPPHSLPPLEFKSESFGPSGPTKTEKYKNFQAKLLHKRKQSEMYSLWCDALYRLSLANHYRDKVFWLPHNMDFRGRVYPIPPHLNHLGSDMARCLLIFNQSQPLGPDGFDWLKLHCINLTGLKKKNSVKERLAYVEEILDDILDSADNPLTGRMWWAKSDEPWQTLSACMEIANVHRSGDPEKYMSSFPIHQDGSCNGLQHYAALGRDVNGAISVNLTPCAVPQDVYNDVAVLVEATRCKDAEAGIEIAKVLEGFVKRKVIKQTVMTTVYGVTRFGARQQIARQLKDIDEFPKDYVYPAASYLTTKTFDSLREMFTSTKEIQDWFTHCARLISTIGGHNVEWVTPLGLPVVQPYNRFEQKMSKNVTAEQISMDLLSKPNIMKQKNAFPPNFIHSLDSSHMMLTSLHCERAGITFISVHDCFWTHANCVPTMNRICREQFVALHSQPILEDLSKYLVNKYSYAEKDFTYDGSVSDTTKRKLNRTLCRLPSTGDFDLKNVLKSIYFFS